MRQEGMPVYQTVESRFLSGVPQRRAIPTVQLCNLRRSKVLNSQSKPDVKGRLVPIRNEQMRFRGVSQRQRQPHPGASRIERAAIVPRSEQTEDLAAVVVSKEAIHLIHGPDHRIEDHAERD